MGSLSEGCVATLIYPAQVLRLFIYSLLLEIEFCSKKKKKRAAKKTASLHIPVYCVSLTSRLDVLSLTKGKKVLCVHCQARELLAKQGLLPLFLPSPSCVSSRTLKSCVSQRLDPLCGCLRVQDPAERAAGGS